MSSIHETAYPRFKPELTQRKVEETYAPTEEGTSVRAPDRPYGAGPAVPDGIAEDVQRLGYFPMLADVLVPDQVDRRANRY